MYRFKATIISLLLVLPLTAAASPKVYEVNTAAATPADKDMAALRRSFDEARVSMTQLVKINTQLQKDLQDTRNDMAKRTPAVSTEVAHLKKIIEEKNDALKKAMDALRGKKVVLDVDRVNVTSFHGEKVIIPGVGPAEIEKVPATPGRMAVRVGKEIEAGADKTFTGAILEKTRSGESVTYSLDLSRAIISR